jgi:hypothetical protein
MQVKKCNGSYLMAGNVSWLGKDPILHIKPDPRTGLNLVG